MKRQLLTLAMLCITAVMFAVPAKRGQWRTITLTDGSKVKVELMGDEFIQYFQAEDGRLFRKAPATPCYEEVTRDEIGRIAMERRMEDAVKNQGMYANGPSLLSLGGDHQPYEGTKKCLCILVEFPDMPFEPEHTLDLFKNMVNTIDYTDEELGVVGSVRDYFRGQSFGIFDIDFDVVGPYQLKHNYEYYGKHTEWSNDANAAAMIREAIDNANPDVNFSDYDWDGDGYAEPIFVVYSGKGEADGGDENTIWPHKSSIQRVKYDGVWIRDYACGSELNGTGRIDGIGTMCHEYSHCLGLPDMYDTQYTGNYGTSSWDIMDSGCYNGNGGDIPAGYTAYERWYAGWLEPIELNCEFTVTDMKPLTSQGNAYTIYNDAYTKEYYLLENRKKESWDAALPGEGLMIYHVDFDKTAWEWNLVNSTAYPDITPHERMAIIPADNSKGSNNIGKDAYPITGNNALMNTTAPSSTLYHANPMGMMFMSKPITNITRSEDGLISFDFADKTEDVPTKPEGSFFFDSFAFCGGEGGNDGNFKPSGKGTFAPDNIGWEADNAFGGNMCAYFGTNTKKGSATTPEFDITDTETSVLTFLAAPFGTEAKSITLSVATGDATLDQTSVSLTSGEWTEFSIKIQGNGITALNFTSNSRRFFLDEVLVQPDDPNGISEIKADAVSNKIYNLAGQQVTAGTKGITISGGRKYVGK